MLVFNNINKCSNTNRNNISERNDSNLLILTIHFLPWIHSQSTQFAAKISLGLFCLNFTLLFQNQIVLVLHKLLKRIIIYRKMFMIWICYTAMTEIRLVLHVTTICLYSYSRVVSQTEFLLMFRFLCSDSVRLSEFTCP